MAGASGLLAGSAFFIALEIIFWFGVQFFGPKSGKGLTHTLYATAVGCCWMLWAFVYMAQMHPLITPQLQA
ncbi:hypothetical protein ABBQ38_013359 [Trebouxia sp. C0009 RCD-2024]